MIIEDVIYRCPIEFKNTVLKLLELFKDNFTKEVLFKKQDLPKLFSLVVPSIKRNLEIKNVDISLIIKGNPNFENSINKPAERDNFFENLDNLSINDNFKQCNKKLTSSKKKILKFLFNSRLLKYLKK